jgi:hypothetical protein
MRLRETVDDWSVDPERHSSSDRLTVRRLEWCIDALRQLGCRVNPSNRLPSAIRLIESVRANRAQLSDARVRNELAEAQRAAWEFMVILIAAVEAEPATTVFTRDKLQLAISGAATANESKTVGRDTQFELYVPALFAISGFAISRGAADALWTFAGEELEIEAKRMTSASEDKLRDNLEKAAGQIMGPKSESAIEVVRARGIIAVNIDVHVATVPAAESKAELIREIAARFDALDRAGRTLIKHHGLVAVLAIGCVAHWELEVDGHPANHLAVSYPLRWVSLVGEDIAEKASVQRFYGAIEAIERRVDELQFKVPKRRAVQ